MLDRSNRNAVEEVQIDGELCAIIVSAQHDDLGIQFFTPNEYSQQIASMSYPSGKIIPAHTHNPVRREVFYTQEALFIRKGKLRVDFYSQEQEYRTSRVLGAGDVVLLIRGGHGFEVLEDLNMVEVKQGHTPATWIRPDSQLSCLPNSNSISGCMIPVNRPLLDGNEKKYLDECIESGWISAEGPFVKKLEAGFAELMGCAYGVAVCNGSVAIEVALAALQI